MAAGDVLETLSLARTALDDPASLWENGRPIGDEEGFTAYAIDRIDEVMHALDVELNPALALTTMGKLIAEIADDLDDNGVGGDGESFDTRYLANELTVALDRIDMVIRRLST